MSAPQKAAAEQERFTSIRAQKAQQALAAYRAALARGADPLELRLLYDAVRRHCGAHR